jgi:hypothetical protein
MITQGLSQHEINLITKILTEYKVRYQVGAVGSADEVKVRGGRGDTSFYMIEIHDGDFESLLPEQAKFKLADLGIYPEMEAPDFSEETPKETKPIKDPEKIKKNMKIMEYSFIAGLILMALAFVRKVMVEQ